MTAGLTDIAITGIGNVEFESSDGTSAGVLNPTGYTKNGALETGGNLAAILATAGAAGDAANATTLMGQLKQVVVKLGSVVLAAGTAVIGKVGLQVGGADLAASNPIPALLNASLFYTGYTTAQAANATYNDTARDAGVAAGTPHPYAYFNALFLADQAGTAYVDGSSDGTTWVNMASAAIVANTPLILDVPVMFRYQRARITNGATLQTSLNLKTSYTGA